MLVSNIQQPNGMDFNEFDKKYRCCCGSVHVKTGALILIFVEVVITFVGVGGSVKNGASFAVSAGVPIIFCITAGCAVAGIKREQRNLLWPLIIWKCIYIGILCLGVLLVLGLAVMGSTLLVDARNDLAMGLMLIIIIVEVIMIAWTAFHIWQLVVIFKCKRYLLEKNPVNLMPTIMYGNGNAIGTQQVIQMQLPTQAWQQPGVQWTIQQTQYQQPIVQQQFQEPFHPFEPPPERTIWGESQEGSQGNEMQEKY